MIISKRQCELPGVGKGPQSAKGGFFAKWERAPGVGKVHTIKNMKVGRAGGRTEERLRERDGGERERVRERDGGKRD